MSHSDLCTPHTLRVRRWQRGHWEFVQEQASREHKVIVDHPRGQCQLWASPRNLAALALGHVIIDQAHDAAEDAPAPEGLRRGSVQELPARVIEERVEHRFCVSLEPRTRNITAHADCGQATAAQLSQYMDAALGCGGLWDGTGCLQRAALVRIDTGKIPLRTEDMGLHNCLDRLAGLCSLQGLAPEEHVLFTSACVTASLYRKARRTGFRFIVSHAAVSSDPLERALAQGVTLVGHCQSQEQRLTVFADGLNRVLPE